MLVGSKGFPTLAVAHGPWHPDCSPFCDMSQMLLDPETIRLPLGRVALCLDCEVCFPLEKTTCPACGSRTSVPIARLLNKGRPSVATAAR